MLQIEELRDLALWLTKEAEWNKIEEYMRKTFDAWLTRRAAGHTERTLRFLRCRRVRRLLYVLRARCVCLSRTPRRV